MERPTEPVAGEICGLRIHAELADEGFHVGRKRIDKAIGGFATSGVNILQLTTELVGSPDGTFSAIEVFAEIEGKPDETQFQLGFRELEYFTDQLKIEHVGPMVEHPSLGRIVEVPRDLFGILRELDALLAELSDHFRKINDPKVITNDMRYVHASADALREFIATYEEADEVEVPVHLPRSLLDRLKSVNIAKIDSIAGTAQRIADIIAKLFL